MDSASRGFAGSIETVRERDLWELLALMRAYCDFYEVEPSDEALLALSRALIADPRAEGVQLLARDGAGQAVGFATVYWSWSTARAGRLGVMNDLFVAPGARGSGAAQGLIAACAERCRHHGAVALEWETALDNARAQKLYDRVGGVRERWLSYSLELLALLALLMVLVLPARGALAQPVEMAAPYEYLGWGDPQAPASVLADSGLSDLTLAFVLSKGACDPEWDGQRPLLGGSDERAIESIRAGGGEVDVSFGGWSGRKLGSSCKTPAALAGAYEKVIDDYSLRAIDVDIEHGEITSSKTRLRVMQALAIVHGADPGLEISVTMGTAESGPERDGVSLIEDAAGVGFMPSSWTIMPFDFGPPAAGDMGEASIRAAEGLAHDLAGAYGVPLVNAYEHSGISSMNGDTDEASEVVSLADMQRMLAFASAHQLARVTFWAVNRDRPCQDHDAPEEECSGIAQEPLAFSALVAGYHG